MTTRITGFAAVLLGCLTFFGPAAASAAGSFSRDGAVIRNSGSTNADGYMIKVWSDATASVQPMNRPGRPMITATRSMLPQALSTRFFADVKAARDNRATGRTCMKSVSFGTSTVVNWHGWTSPDLECPGGGYVAALANDVHEIANALGAASRVHRIRRLPNEPRRAPVEPAPSQEPTGEPTQP